MGSSGLGRIVVLAACVWLGLAAAFAAPSARPAGSESNRADEGGRDPILERIRGAEPSGGQAAREFVSVLQANEPLEAAARYRKALDVVFDPEALARSRDAATVAERVASAAAHLAASGRPYEEGAAKMAVILGLGPESLRRTLREALLATIRQELKSGGPSATAELLSRRLVAPPVPGAGAPKALRELSQILWEIDGKAVLGLLIDGLALNREQRSAAAGYVMELRELLRLELASVDAWQLWWAEHRDKTLEGIQAAARRSADERSTELWKRTFQRLREAEAPERYYQTLVDAFQSDSRRGLRLAVLAELAAFPQWLRELRFSVDAAGEAARLKHLEPALEFLLRVFEGTNGFGALTLDLRAAAVAALGSYHAAFERSPELQARAARGIIDELKGFQPPSSPGWDAATRRYVIELVRAVGALRLESDEPRALLLEFLRRENSGVQNPEAGGGDPELLAALTSSVGKLLGRQGAEEGVRLVLEVYRGARDRSEKAWRDLRKACVSALHLPVAPEDLRQSLRQLYGECVERSDDGNPERIPAIIGLGILANDGDQPSAALLVDILRRRSRFEVSEVNAAIDALAYLGGEKSLECFTAFLSQREGAFGEQIWRKVTTLIKVNDPRLLTWLVGRLEREALESDRAEVAQVLAQLGQEPGVAELFAPQKAQIDSAERLREFWRRAWSLVRASRLLEKPPEELQAQLAGLEELVLKNEPLAPAVPEAKGALEALRRTLRLEDELRMALAKAPLAPVAELVAKLQLLLKSSGEEPLERWLELCWIRAQIQRLTPAAETHALAAALHESLASPAAAPLWQVFPPELRERILKSFEAQRERLRLPQTSG